MHFNLCFTCVSACVYADRNSCSQDTINACARKRKEDDIRSYELQAKRNTNELVDPRFVDYFNVPSFPCYN